MRHVLWGGLRTIDRKLGWGWREGGRRGGNGGGGESSGGR